MKRFLLFLIVLGLLLTGCVPKEHVADGTYVAASMNGNEYTCPYIDINREDQTFVHGASMAHSFAVFCDYEIKGNTLRLLPTNGEGVMVFVIDGSELIYDAEVSTIPPMVSGSGDVPDGTVFSSLKGIYN